MNTSLSNLPVEIQLQFLQYLAPNDLCRCSKVNSSLKSVITNHSLYLQRIPCTFRFVVGDEWRVELQVNGRDNKFECSVSQFDDHMLSRVSIEHFKLAGNGNVIPDYVFSLLLNYFIRFRHYRIKSVSITDSTVTHKSDRSFKSFFLLTLKTLSHLNVCNSTLSIDVPSEAVELSEELVNFRWINSIATSSLSGNQLNASTAAVKRFTQATKQMTDKKQTIQLDTTIADPAVVAEFVNAWSETVDAPFFTMIFQQISPDWKEHFLHECARRRLTHVFYEFPSKRQPTAHIKVKFHPELNRCEMWPVFDVPARTSGQQICYARYFRDF